VEAWPAARVLEQIQGIVEAGFREIYFRDETFSAFRERNREVCREILRRNIEVGWICNIKPGTADLDDLRLMKAAGCRLVKVGVESGAGSVLDLSGKGICVDTTRRMMDDIHAVGLDSHAHVMIGMPGESDDTIRQTLDLILEVEPTTVDVGICTPLPGTRMWEELFSTRPEARENAGVESAALHTVPVFSDFFCDVGGKELEAAVRRIYRRFYCRPKYLWQRAREARTRRRLSDTFRYGLSVMRFILG
jgi:radical SAM superfamily enzyme YgiQ (UPF0313 family)